MQENLNPFELTMNCFGKGFEGIDKKLQQPSNENVSIITRSSNPQTSFNQFQACFLY